MYQSQFIQSQDQCTPCPPLLARGPHGAHVVHQLLVLHEAAAAEVAGPRAPRDARPCRARRGAGVGGARPPGEVKQWIFFIFEQQQSQM